MKAWAFKTVCREICHPIAYLFCFTKKLPDRLLTGCALKSQATPGQKQILMSSLPHLPSLSLLSAISLSLLYVPVSLCTYVSGCLCLCLYLHSFLVFSPLSVSLCELFTFCLLRVCLYILADVCPPICLLASMSSLPLSTHMFIWLSEISDLFQRQQDCMRKESPSVPNASLCLRSLSHLGMLPLWHLSPLQHCQQFFPSVIKLVND